MSFTFSNFLAAASIIVWASAWAATEKSASSAETALQRASAASVQASSQSEPAVKIKKNASKSRKTALLR